MLVTHSEPTGTWSINACSTNHCLRCYKCPFCCLQHTSVMFDYSVSHERDGVVEGGWDAEEDMEALRSVMVFTADKLDQFITELETELQ